jgi:DNA-binding transcriptional LysR family regulator
VSLPVRAGIDFLGAWLIDFACLHPELQLDMALSNSNQNLVQDEIDLAFRVGPLIDSSAIALYLWDIPYSLFAHQDFLDQHGLRDGEITEQQVETLPSVVARPATQWFFIDQEHKEVKISPQANLLVDDLGLANHAAQTGRYMVMSPIEMVTHPDMVQLAVTGLVARTRTMYAYYLGRRHAQSQIKQLIQYIKQRADAEKSQR